MSLEVRDIVSQQKYLEDRENRLKPRDLTEDQQYIGRIKVERFTSEAYAGDLQFYLSHLNLARDISRVILLPVLMETGQTVNSPIDLEVKADGIIVPQPSRRATVGMELGYFLADLDIWGELDKLANKVPVEAKTADRELITV